jgi:hypothetical protein
MKFLIGGHWPAPRTPGVSLAAPPDKPISRETAPFSHLPENFSQPFIELRFTFYYNLPIPQK